MDVPVHPLVPACRFHLCRVCASCGAVHHGGGDVCIRCWTAARTTKPAS